MVFKTAEGQTVGEAEPVAVWNYDEALNTYRENGEELSIISKEEVAFSGKRPRPETAHKLKVTKSIPVKDIASYFEEKTGATLDKDKLSINFLAADNFGYSSSYYKLVNRDGASDLLYNEKLNEANMTEGSPVDGVLALELTNSVDVANEEFSTEKTNAKTPRLYTGVDKETSNYNDIANFGYASPSNVSKITFKEHYEVTLSGLDEAVKTEDAVYLSDKDGYSVKLEGNNQVIKPGTKVEFSTQRGAIPSIMTKPKNRADKSIELTPNSEDIYKWENEGTGEAMRSLLKFRIMSSGEKFSFIMPDSDIEIKLNTEGTQYSQNIPYAYIRMEYPRNVEDEVEFDINIRAYNKDDKFDIELYDNQGTDTIENIGIASLQTRIKYNDQYKFNKRYVDGYKFESPGYAAPSESSPYAGTASVLFVSAENTTETGLALTGTLKNPDGITDFDSIQFFKSMVGIAYKKSGYKVPAQFEKDYGTVVLPYDTRYVEDPELKAGEKVVSQEGVNGVGRKIKSDIWIQTDIVPNTSDEWVEVTKAPVDKIVKYGTKAPEPIVIDNTDIEKLPSAEYIDKVDNTEKTIDIYKVKADGTKVTEADIKSGIKATDDTAQEYQVNNMEELVVTSEDGTKEAAYTINLLDRDQDAPTNVNTVPVSKKGLSDGKITDVDSSMEYRAKGTITDPWLPVNETQVTGLRPGTYEVRYKAKEGYKPSPATEVTVEDGPAIENTDIEKLPSAEYIDKVDNTEKTIDIYKVKADGTKVTEADIKSGIKATDDTAQEYQVNNMEELVVTSEDGTKEATYAINLLDRDQDAPTNVNTVPVSKKGLNDGKITDVDSSMEYKAKEDSAWKNILGDKIENLNPGTYEVRYKAKEGYKPSPATEVTVEDAPSIENTDIEKLPSAEYIDKVDNENKTIDIYRVKADGTKVTETDIKSGIKATDDTAQEYQVNNMEELLVKSEDGTKEATYTINLLDREQTAPANVKSEPASKEDAADGKITGVDSSMEYKAKEDSAWKNISGDKIENLKPGIYEVRYKAKEGYKPSPSVEVKVGVAEVKDNTDIEKLPDAEFIKEIDNETKTVKLYKVKADGTKVTDEDITSNIKATDDSEQLYEVRNDMEDLVVTAENNLVAVSYELVFIDRDQDAPEGLRATHVSKKGESDGKITGVDESMEYQLKGSEEWEDIDGNTIEGLPEGTYLVRYKAKEGYEASPATEVTVRVRSGGGSGGGTVTPPGDDDDKPEEPGKPEVPGTPSDEIKLEGPYIKGYPDQTFGPDKEITRAEAAAMVARILSKNADLQRLSNKYPDVTDGWYREAVDYMTENGYMKGYPEGDFRPDDKMTRAEFAEMIKKIGKEEKFGRIDFKDINGHWASEAIHLASVRGLVIGYEDNTFRPDNRITRAEVVTILNRLFDIEATDAEKEDIIKNATNPFTDLKTDHWGYADVIIASTEYKLKK